MAINKVIDRNGNTLIDLTRDTISPNKVLEGVQFHGPDGNIHTGSLPANELDTLKYNFIDYEGTLLYSLTDTELDALIELPAGVDHTDENLTFQGWNWTLEKLKAWDRTRPDRPIVGAHYITTDGKSYIYMDSPISNGSLTLSLQQINDSLCSIDWGDGTVESGEGSFSHTYNNPGEYTIIIDGNFYFSSGSTGKGTLRQWIKHIKLGSISSIRADAFYNLYSLETITIPNNNISTFGASAFSNCRRLSSITIPNSVTRIYRACFTGNYSLKIISLPPNITSIDEICFSTSKMLQNLTIPDSVETIGSSAFRECINLKKILLPPNLLEIPTYFFYGCTTLETVIIQNNVTRINSEAFSGCKSLTNIDIPNGVTSIDNNAFYGCDYLESITIPDSVTSIGTNAFGNCYSLILDLSQQTKVIQLTASIGSFNLANRNKISIPIVLLDQYKSANYWSSNAECMIGV